MFLVTSSSVCLYLFHFAPQLGAGRTYFPPYSSGKTSFLFWYRYFFSHVTRGAGHCLGRRLPGSSCPSTPAEPGVRGRPSRGPFALPGAASPLWALAPNTPCGRDLPFPGFNRYLNRSLAIRGTGCGPQRPPGDHRGLQDISGPRASGVRAPGYELGASSLCGRMDFLIFLGGPRKTPSPILKVFLISKAASQS